MCSVGFQLESESYKPGSTVFRGFSGSIVREGDLVVIGLTIQSPEKKLAKSGLSRGEDAKDVTGISWTGLQLQACPCLNCSQPAGRMCDVEKKRSKYAEKGNILKEHRHVTTWEPRSEIRFISFLDKQLELEHPSRTLEYPSISHSIYISSLSFLARRFIYLLHYQGLIHVYERRKHLLPIIRIPVKCHPNR